MSVTPRVQGRPPVWVRAGAAVLAVVVGGVLGVRRSHVLSSMRRAGVADPERSCWAMYRNLARGVFELLWLLVNPRRALARVAVLTRVSAPARTSRGEAWDAGSAQHPSISVPPGGGVIATAHTGNWDLVACAAARELPLAVITKHLRIRWLDRLWQGVRSRQGVQLLSAGSARATALAHLRRGGYLAALIDQAPERRRAVVASTFLGAGVHIDLAPALLAMRARVPLLVVFPRRLGSWDHTSHLALVVEPPEVPSRAWAERTMVRATRELERFVLAHPDQWLWMHRRWKPLPAEPRLGFDVPTLPVRAAPTGEAQDILPGE